MDRLDMVGSAHPPARGEGNIRKELLAIAIKQLSGTYWHFLTAKFLALGKGQFSFFDSFGWEEEQLLTG
ncbi:MAG: hypothetical protein ACYC6G_13305 [Desulfobaccales bacterium]